MTLKFQNIGTKFYAYYYVYKITIFTFVKNKYSEIEHTFYRSYIYY